VGRVANRIGGAKFKLNGHLYKTDPNEGRNTLHGTQNRSHEINLQLNFISINCVIDDGFCCLIIIRWFKGI